MPISCHFQDCEALLFVLTTCKQHYIKYPGFFLQNIENLTARDTCITWLTSEQLLRGSLMRAMLYEDALLLQLLIADLTAVWSTVSTH